MNNRVQVWYRTPDNQGAIKPFAKKVQSTVLNHEHGYGGVGHAETGGSIDSFVRDVL